MKTPPKVEKAKKRKMRNGLTVLQTAFQHKSLNWKF